MFWSSDETSRRSVITNMDESEIAGAAEYYDANKVNKNVRLNFKKVVEELKMLEIKNQKNEQIIKSLRKAAKTLVSQRVNDPLAIEEDGKEIHDNPSSNAPSKFFEDTRRKLFADIKDLKYFLNSQLKKSEIVKDQDTMYVDIFKKSVNDRIDLALVELYNLSISDNLGDWRQAESKQLSAKIKQKFHKLQNPVDCLSARKLICDLNKACGYGCQIHHLMYCFIIAYFTDRTLILESNNWKYNRKGFTAYFEPISETCTHFQGDFTEWNRAAKGNIDEVQTVKLPIVDSLGHRPAYLPLTIPKEFHTEMQRFHGDPFVWWAGQMLSYLTRFNSDFKKVVAAKRDELSFQNGCVGVHVRRTDKVGTEAAFHGLDEYMAEVEQYYNFKKMSDVNEIGIHKCVYLASDEIEVLKEAREKYPDYQFIFDEENAKTASLSERYSPASAQGVILDIHFLSECDFLVCTFSSQVCRLAYEYMQTRFPDASWRFRSLDDVYYYGGQNGHNVLAVFDHIPRRGSGEIELKKGDFVGIAGNHWNGFSKGKNQRTGKTGLFPSYKVIDHIQVY